MAKRDSEKDQSMARMLKEQGVTRTMQRCPMCHRPIPVNRLSQHLTPYCRG